MRRATRVVLALVATLLPVSALGASRRAPTSRFRPGHPPTRVVDHRGRRAVARDRGQVRHAQRQGVDARPGGRPRRLPRPSRTLTWSRSDVDHDGRAPKHMGRTDEGHRDSRPRALQHPATMWAALTTSRSSRRSFANVTRRMRESHRPARRGRRGLTTTSQEIRPTTCCRGTVREDYRRATNRCGSVGSNKLNADSAAPPGATVGALHGRPRLADARLRGRPPGGAGRCHPRAVRDRCHPFEDGNGRVGRALVHGILKRAGLVDGGVTPLSTAFRNDERGYIDALTSYRYDGDATYAGTEPIDRAVPSVRGDGNSFCRTVRRRCHGHPRTVANRGGGCQVRLLAASRRRPPGRAPGRLCALPRRRAGHIQGGGADGGQAAGRSQHRPSRPPGSTASRPCTWHDDIRRCLRSVPRPGASGAARLPSLRRGRSRLRRSWCDPSWSTSRRPDLARTG